MIIIALKGAPNTGKTQTLNFVHNKLLHLGLNRVSGCFMDLENDDFLDVLIDPY